MRERAHIAAARLSKMAPKTAAARRRLQPRSSLIAVIGDEDTVTGWPGGPPMLEDAKLHGCRLSNNA